MTISDEVGKRGITEVLHFTTNRGIVGTLATGALLSRHRLPLADYLQHILHVNAADRPEAREFFDKSQNWLDFVNLSISEINRRYFLVSQKWHIDADIWWGILAFDPIVMSHDEVVFTTTNNSYDLCVRKSGLLGFNDLFEPCIPRKAPRWKAHRLQRPSFLPTCEQAEVLYLGQISTEYLRRIYVQDENCHDIAKGWLREFGLRGVDVLISPQKFEGQPN
ncbi:DarT ssDNA thymidine ADP-ribosyltransferase family protein [Pseudomonas marginalis]|uniref:DarT ssDNA thymidine ADP-ribosyltransferase family protein n=1 Tax=Pseudomonas marginalis TaxID=298 RepID=UPI0034D67034